jgi:hypoxanthine phosphoribosyltransferase
MPMKVENRASVTVKDLEAQIQNAVECLPAEHLRGFNRILVVDTIRDSRLTIEQTQNLPALYHPRMPGTPAAYGEIALAILLPKTTFLKRVAARAQFRASLAVAVFSLAAQHYLITISSRKKKGGGIERVAREYVDRYFKIWRDRQGGLRARLFRPLIPYLERWQKSVRRRYAEEARKRAAN